MNNNGYVKEYDLYFDTAIKNFFNCCGDEDLYPFKCAGCGHVMVHCYECETLYEYINENYKERRRFNYEDCTNKCTKCGNSLDNLYFDNRYFVSYEEWIKEGYSSFLRRYENDCPPVPYNILIEGDILNVEFEWVAHSSNKKGIWFNMIKNSVDNSNGEIEFTHIEKPLIEEFNINYLKVRSDKIDEYLKNVFKYSLKTRYLENEKKKQKGLIWNPVLLDFVNTTIKNF